MLDIPTDTSEIALITLFGNIGAGDGTVGCSTD